MNRVATHGKSYYNEPGSVIGRPVVSSRTGRTWKCKDGQAGPGSIKLDRQSLEGAKLG